MLFDLIALSSIFTLKVESSNINIVDHLQTKYITFSLLFLGEVGGGGGGLIVVSISIYPIIFLFNYQCDTLRLKSTT